MGASSDVRNENMGQLEAWPGFLAWMSSRALTAERSKNTELSEKPKTPEKSVTEDDLKEHQT